MAASTTGLSYQHAPTCQHQHQKRCKREHQCGRPSIAVLTHHINMQCTLTRGVFWLWLWLFGL